MAERMIVIGGDAAGMTAASQARRRRDEGNLRIVVFERGRYTSYSACGIPYWVAGDVGDADDLVVRWPEEHRERGIDVRMRTEVTAIDVRGRRVRARSLGEPDGEGWTGFDHLVIATGAVPVRPELPGLDAPNVYGVQTLDDGHALVERLGREAGGEAWGGRPGAGGGGERDSAKRDSAKSSSTEPGREWPRDAAGSGAGTAPTGRAVIVGAGYIGVEMAEALLRRGMRVTVLEHNGEPMATLDPDMGRLVREAMEGMGIEVVTGATVSEVLRDGSGSASAVVTEGGKQYPADVVVLGLGVRPNTALARAAGLPLGESGGLLTDLSMRVRGAPGIWAGGDCVEVLNLVSGRLQHIPLGTHANKHGQVIGVNIGGGYATFPGVVGTAVSKVCDVEIARTGLLESQARAAGLQFVTAVARSTSRAGYFPGAAPMTVKVLAERGTGRLLGMQIVGREGAGKRVDVGAVALTNRMTVEAMTALDLGYAPPFSPVWDPVLVAARKAVAAVSADRCRDGEERARRRR